MIIKNFRGEEFINRDKEIRFFLEHFKTNPKRVMWVYGPKSTGKTTLIEYIIENKLNQKEYWIKYLNLRGQMVSTYENFIYSFFDELDEDEDIQTELNKNSDLKIFKLEAKTIKKIKEHKKNLFVELINKLQTIKKKKILIIDEIQTLQEIYMNGGRLLLNEFLNFCIRLTKETHLSHVLILTSNTIFLNQIYNNAKMKVTSDFKLIDHLNYEDIKTWLLNKDIGFSISDVELIYDYLGGSTAHIKKLIDFKNEYNSIKEQLEEMAQIAKNEIIFEKNKNLTNKEFELFLKIILWRCRNL